METDDQRNARLEAEIKARPDYKQIEDEFNLKGTVPPVTGGDSERERIYKARYGNAEIDSDSATFTPDSDLSPELRALKAKYEGAATQAGAPTEFQAQWQAQLASIEGFVDPETQQREIEQAEKGMRERWGTDYDTRRVEFVSGVQYVEKKYPEIFNDVAFSSLGNDPVIIDAIQRIGARLK